MSQAILAYLATAFLTGATLVAAIISGLLIAKRGVPRWLALSDGVLCAAGLGLHMAAQLGEEIDHSWMTAVPFITIGAVAGVVLAWRRLRGERPRTTLTVAHAGALLIGLILAIESAASLAM